MKRLTALAAFLLVLLPTHLPWWLDTARPVGGTPLSVVRGTVGRHDTLASALEGLVPPAGVQRLVAAARPIHDLARISVGRPFGVALGPDGLMRAFTYGIDELRTLRVVRDGDDLRADVLARQLRDARRDRRGHDRVEPLRRDRGRRRGRPARPGPRGHLRLGRGLQHRDPARRLVPRGGREALPRRRVRALRADPGGRVRPGRPGPAGLPPRGCGRGRLLRLRGTPAAQGLPPLAAAVHAHLVALQPLAPAPGPARPAGPPRRRLRGALGDAGGRRRRRRRERGRLDGRATGER